jgi:Gpi18-like mannosyltransferase
MKIKEAIKVLNLFLIWLIFLSLVVILADKFLVYKPSFPYAAEFSRYGLSKSISKLANFDGVHYLTISEKGYLGTGLIQAFFPLYPILMRVANYSFHNYLISGLAVSHLFALLSFYSFYYLVRMDNGKKIALTALMIFASFSTSFYLRSLYGESLFLTLIFGSLIAAKKKHYLLSGILGGLASATRIVGIFIFPSLLFLIFTKDKKNLKAYFQVSLSVLGLLAYMIYLKIYFGDFLFFFHLQEKFGASRQTNLILYPQVVYRYLKIFITVRPTDLKYYAYVQEFFLSISSLIILLAATLQTLRKKIKLNLAYLIFAFGAYFLPTFTGNFSSMPRYILVCFPMFIYLAMILEKKPKLKFLYLTSSLIFLIINLLLFSQGYWIA